ncbi:hypothetical protein [Baekduia sp. Peel2402]|uniref:hypothetical protein n=1 Tax=Baekduia sp. Peel2402 TaxID=3458296 RepID=UPI00403E6799
MSGRHWRFAVFVGCGLLALPTLYLLMGNWAWAPNPNGASLEGEGLAGAIGFWPLFITLLVCGLGMLVALVAEVRVRHRTEQRPPRGEYERYRP